MEAGYEELRTWRDPKGGEVMVAWSTSMDGSDEKVFSDVWWSSDWSVRRPWTLRSWSCSTSNTLATRRPKYRVAELLFVSGL